jgi:ClpP class serine protease
MRRPNAQTLYESPWAILPSTLSRIVDWGQSASVDASKVVALDGPHDGATRLGTVSILPVYGVIEHRSDWMLEMFGGVSVDGLRESLRAELNDPSVKAVVLDIDSPGGTVAGVTELAAEIRGARGGAKPIIAVANTLAASAAYWLASQADELVVTPSGHVGAIGIYTVHQEGSRMLDEMGITTTIVSAGEHKT